MRTGNLKKWKHRAEPEVRRSQKARTRSKGRCPRMKAVLGLLRSCYPASSLGRFKASLCVRLSNLVFVIYPFII